MNEFLSGLCFPDSDFLPCPSLPPHYYPHKQIWRTCFEQQTEDSSSLFLFRKRRSRFPSTERERERESAFVWRLFLERNLDFPTQIAMLTAFSTTKGLRSFRKQQQACTLVARFFFRPRAPSPAYFALAPPATKEEEESFIPKLLFRAISSLRNVSTFIYDKIYDYVYMNSIKYELVHTLLSFLSASRNPKKETFV